MERYSVSLEYQLTNPLPLEIMSLLFGVSLIDMSIEWAANLVRGAY